MNDLQELFGNELLQNPLLKQDVVVQPRRPAEATKVRRIETNLTKHDIDLYGVGPIKIERDENGLLMSIAGRKVLRDAEGFITQLV